MSRDAADRSVCATKRYNSSQMAKVVRRWWWETLCVLVYVLIAGNQLFRVPITGMGDNGDFPKVLGYWDACDPDQYREYVVPVYKIKPECNWESHVTSSETALAGIITQIAVSNERDSFSIQAAGKAHLSILLAALGILLWAFNRSRPILRFGLPPLIVLIFSDVAYVAYLNSFYMDAAAMVFLLLTVSLAVAAVLRPQSWIAIAFGIAAVGFIASKSQHAVLGPLLAALAVWLAMRGARRNKRLWMASAAAATVSTVAMFILTTDEYRTYPMYNLIFFRLTTHSPDPLQTLAELGLPASDSALVGTHSYSPNVPASDDKWERQFLRQTSYLKLARYYLDNPRVPLTMLWTTLRDEARWIRTPDLGNYRKKDGFPPGTLARRFDWWSNLRSRLVKAFPAHLAIFYVLVTGVSLACLFLPTLAARWPLYPVSLALAIAGAMEFACAALLDCIETARHLFLFHVITEILIVCAVAAVLSELATDKHGSTPLVSGYFFKPSNKLNQMS